MEWWYGGMTLQVVLKERKRVREVREPPLSSREYDCKALGCFLASCRCGHCNGAAATWDIPHMTFIQGRALTDASKQLCGTAKKGSLVTLDKARDYHINLRAATMLKKHTGPASVLAAPPEAISLAAQWRSTLTKCPVPRAFMCLHEQVGFYSEQECYRLRSLKCGQSVQAWRCMLSLQSLQCALHLCTLSSWCVSSFVVSGLVLNEV